MYHQRTKNENRALKSLMGKGKQMLSKDEFINLYLSAGETNKKALDILNNDDVTEEMTAAEVVEHYTRQSKENKKT